RVGRTGGQASSGGSCSAPWRSPSARSSCRRSAVSTSGAGAPPHPHPHPHPHHRETAMSSLEAIARELRWSAVRASAVRYLLHAMLGASAWILAVVLVARFVPMEQALRVAALGVPVAFAAVAVAWIAARPSSPGLMRTADMQLGLKERLATATTPPQIDPQVQKILQDARAKIAAAPDPRAALQTITPAEQKLLQLSDPQTPARASSAQNLANALAATTSGRATSQALNAS